MLSTTISNSATRILALSHGTLSTLCERRLRSWSYDVNALRFSDFYNNNNNNNDKHNCVIVIC